MFWIYEELEVSENYTELLCCPFCGLTPKIEIGNDRLMKIICPESSCCTGSGLFICFTVEDTEKAIAAWNTRSGMRNHFARIMQVYCKYFKTLLKTGA